jgi:uncharacterized Zn-binding protein involved in type VI secretion|tara:strand:+ start:11914 stop:12213 length:300 start_codon:yes stop_codon:yes gene_type:complete
MPLIARETDTVDTGHGCTSETTLDAPGQTFVKIQGEYVARLGDPTVSHTHNPPLCPSHTEYINGSSAVVKVCGILVGRVDDGCDAGKITSGASAVNVGA